ncbi:MAG: ATP-binding protein [Armatimonadetes bacterium]|nr:ATP-binding protein [Armatimonadota bacterium]
MAFFGRYRRLMRLTYGVLLAISAALFLMNLRTQYRSTRSLMDERFRQTADSIDFLVKSLADHVEGFRAGAETYWREDARSCPYGALAGQLRELPGNKGIALEPVRVPFKASETGNVTGAGKLTGRSPSFAKSIRVALGLNPLFGAALRNMPGVVWAYYTSIDDFILMYPWVPYTEYHYSAITHTGEFFALGKPGVNPGRRRFWTGVYVDQCGKGLMVTCGAPVYAGDKFMGTVAADATLDLLNSYINGYPYKSSTLFIVNDRGEMLAHPGLVRSTDPDIKNVKLALPPATGLTQAKLAALTSGKEYVLGGYVVVCQQLKNAPWRVVMLTPQSAMVRSVAGQSAGPLVVLLFGMTLMLLVANSLTRREFIEPAEKLVTHIDAASRTPDTAIPPVPDAWRSWFDTVSRVFSEHSNLLEQLRSQNEHLEEMVAARTAEVSKRNVELAAAMERLKEMQRQIVTQEKMAALGGLTAGIAHEIKNPLNFVNNFSELSLGLLDEMADLLQTSAERVEPDDMADIQDILGDLRQNAAKVNEHGKRADSIVRGMLLHSRGKPGQAQETDLNALVAEYVNLAYHGMRAVDAEFNVKIETEYDQAVGRVSVVPQDLSRAILNIVNNACYAAYDARKHRPAGFQPAIRVSTKVAGDRIEVRIRDNGEGIPAEVREKVFTPFYTTKPAGKGTGLGLSITYDIIVQEHSGELLIESEDHAFTEFIIRLPRGPLGQERAE